MDLTYYKNVKSFNKPTIFWINEQGKVWNTHTNKFMKIYKNSYGREIFSCYDFNTKKSRNLNIAKVITSLFGYSKVFKDNHRILIINGEEQPDYYINRSGRVWSTYYARYLNTQTMQSGYNSIRLKISQEKYKTCYIHILVAETWICFKPKGKEINHIDYDKNNNHMDNLEWVTRKENANKRSNNLTHILVNLQSMFWSKRLYYNIICKKGKSTLKFRDAFEAAKKFNVTDNNIRVSAAEGRIKDGYRLYYSEELEESYVFKNKLNKKFKMYFDGELTEEDILKLYLVPKSKMALKILLDNCNNINEVKKFTQNKLSISVKDTTKFELTKINRNYY